MENVKFENLRLCPEILKAVNIWALRRLLPFRLKRFLLLWKERISLDRPRPVRARHAFGIPLLQKINPKEKKPQSIILCPTRELAIQVAEEIRSLAKYMHGIKVLPIYGGQEIVKQIRSLKSGVQIIVGTPGRVMGICGEKR